MIFNDHFQNFKKYLSTKAQLIIADIPYNLGVNAYASNPAWVEETIQTKKDIKEFGFAKSQLEKKQPTLF